VAERRKHKQVTVFGCSETLALMENVQGGLVRERAATLDY